jgi:hypothetical protein
VIAAPSTMRHPAPPDPAVPASRPSEYRIPARRRNTLSSTRRRGGPVTATGKAITRSNATKHGLLSEVIPGHEVDAYTRHVELIRAHFQPRGYLEEILTERIANTLWRLARVARYEQATIKRSVDRHLRRESGTSLPDLVAELNELAESSEPEAEELIRFASAYLNEAVAIASLPADLIEKVPRYEAHLDRTLKRAVEQLRELIASRQ